LHKRIAGAIRDARHGRLTAQELAEATAALGYPITRSQIANYESGRTRSLDIAELLVLAEALDVSALSLLFPGPADHHVEVLPGKVVRTLDAVKRFDGDGAALWPRLKVAALIKELDQIRVAMGGQGELSG
jgi:transcriptional regulator with XRE-family HTH domain